MSEDNKSYEVESISHLIISIAESLKEINDTYFIVRDIENEKEKKEMTAKKKIKKLETYVRKAENVPIPPPGYASLRTDVGSMLSEEDLNTVEVEVTGCSKEEKTFLVNACKKLGFKPKWKR